MVRILINFVRVLGEFPEADDDTIIPLHLVEAAIDRDVEPLQGASPVWGLDVARFGSDRTALAKRRANQPIEPIKSWQGKDLMQICGIILEEYDACAYEDRPAEILVDVIGLGAGVVDRLREMDFCTVRGVNVSESAALSASTCACVTSYGLTAASGLSPGTAPCRPTIRWNLSW